MTVDWLVFLFPVLQCYSSSYLQDTDDLCVCALVCYKDCDVDEINTHLEYFVVVVAVVIECQITYKLY